VRGLSFVCLAFAACGANTATNDFSSPVTACRSFATSVCTREAACNPGNGLDINTCAQLLASSNNCNQAGCGTNVYSPTDAQQCNNDYLNQSCADSNAGTIPASCEPTMLCPAP
jgi:hypothetical protein